MKLKLEIIKSLNNSQKISIKTKIRYHMIIFLILNVY
jgi:hypothetical protein